MDVVDGIVVETPRPERPDLWIAIHKHGYLDRYYARLEVDAATAKAVVSKCTEGCIAVRIPGSDSPPAAPVGEDAVERLKAALKEYGCHKRGCEYVTYASVYPCTCGLAAALAAMEGR